MFGMAGIMGAAAASAGGAEFFGWTSGIPNHAVSTTDLTDDTMSASPGRSWGTCALVSYPITGGKVSIDVEILTLSSPNRLGVGVSRVSNIAPYTPNAIYSSTNLAFCEGVVFDPVTVGDIATVELDYSTGVITVKKNNTPIGSSSTITPGGNTWYFAFDEYEDFPAWKLVRQVYAPSAGYTKINP